MLKELGIQDPNFVKILPDRARCAKTYIRTSRSLDTIVKEHNLHLRNTLPLLPLMQGLPFLMWSSKMNKNQPSQRFITLSSRCTTKPLSMLITFSLKRILGQRRTHANILKKEPRYLPYVDY